jgi:hypothetical protein
VFESKVVLRPELEDQKLKNELTIKQMNYSKHEFVKVNEVGLLITEAMQGLLDKISQEKKVTQANKSQLRL